MKIEITNVLGTFYATIEVDLFDLLLKLDIVSSMNVYDKNGKEYYLAKMLLMNSAYRLV